RDKVEPVYVRPDSHAENFARENPNKTIRYIQTPIRPASISGFLRGIQLTFNRDKAKGFHCTLHFEFTGKEKETATIHIADEKIRVEKGIQGQADVRVKTDTQTWLNIVNGEASEVWAVITGKLNVKGPLKLLQRFKDCVKP
ncbi:MAG: SCP2 sterol-binding domain-containing protein, partial [Nitrospinales bacterium]